MPGRRHRSRVAASGRCSWSQLLTLLVGVIVITVSVIVAQTQRQDADRFRRAEVLVQRIQYDVTVDHRHAVSSTLEMPGAFLRVGVLA